MFYNFLKIKIGYLRVCFVSCVWMVFFPPRHVHEKKFFKSCGLGKTKIGKKNQILAGSVRI